MTLSGGWNDENHPSHPSCARTHDGLLYVSLYTHPSGTTLEKSVSTFERLVFAGCRAHLFVQRGVECTARLNRAIEQ